MAKTPKVRAGKASKPKIVTSGTTIRLPGKRPNGGTKGGKN